MSMLLFTPLISSQLIFTLFLLGCSFSCLSAFCNPFGKTLYLAVYKRLSFRSSESLWSWNMNSSKTMTDYYYFIFLLFAWWSDVLTSVLRMLASSSVFDSCSLLQDNIKCKLTNLKYERYLKLNEIHLTYHYLPHFEKIVGEILT